MLTTLYRSAAVWTAAGLAGGLFYREFTKAHDVEGGTQLALVHTHALALGTTVLLVLMALVAALGPRVGLAFRWGVHTWNAGLALTVGGLLVKGCLQVLKNPTADSPAIAGVSGLGHMILTTAFVLIFVGLAPTVRARAASDTADLAVAADAQGLSGSRS